MPVNEAARTPAENRILAALPDADSQRLAPHLEVVNLPRGQILYRADQFIEHVYFPSNSMVSLISQLSDGTGIEVGVVGFEGVVGLPAFLGVDKSPQERIVQIPDGGVRVRVEAALSEFRRGCALHDSVLRYTQSVLLTTSQLVTCNRAHSIGERLARWLLMSYDRCPQNELPLTQEFLALMLGTRRAGVTEAAILLQAEGAISYSRGRVTITDIEGLEESACECYRVIKAEFDRLRPVQTGRGH